MANNLLGGIPSPTVNHNLEDKISRVNSTPRLKAASDAAVALTKRNDNDIQDNSEHDGEMVDATNAVETVAIGGRAHIGRLILEAQNKGTIEPIKKIHLQRKENNETKWIKAAFTSPRLNEARAMRGHGHCKRAARPNASPLRTHSRNSQQIDLRDGAPHQIP